MLWYKKLLRRAEAAKLTGNKLALAENAVWHFHCFIGIYRAVFGSRTLKQRIAYIAGGIFLYLFQVPIIIAATAVFNSVGGLVGWYLKWFCILLFPVGWFVALPMLMYSIEHSEDRRRK